MAKAYRPAGGTAEHVAPQVPSDAFGSAALIAVFPAAAAMGVPDGPVGRNWLAAHGCIDPEVSGEHLRFAARDGELCVADAGSRNGTWLDGQRLEPGGAAELSDGAVLRVGRTLLVYKRCLEGAFQPAAPIGELVGPFGLRSVATSIASLERREVNNVLIEGETGTGKELAAHAVAAALGRATPFAAINVAGVSAGVFESQLFGHVSGAFTGALGSSRGVVLAHEGGAVFLDEIGELPVELQPKLLRLLENRELLPVGAERPVHADVLILAATNRDLDALVAMGTFRRDLHARLSMARVVLPPLRERREDLVAIMQAVAARQGTSFDAATVEVEALERLLLHPWPSNVRGVMAALGEIAVLTSSSNKEPGLRLWAVERVLGPREAPPDKALTRDAVEAALRLSAGNESQAARHLGVTRGKLRRLLKKLHDAPAKLRSADG